MMRASLVAGVLAAGLGGLASSVHGQWSTDAAANTPISLASGTQDVCKVSARADGGCWIAWFATVPAPTNYNMRLQRLDGAGAPQLGADGILVSGDNPSFSFTAGD